MKLGVVVIGRNEGERLRRCLESLRSEAGAALVYVDSGSTDGSAEMARSMGAEVIDLDMSLPFTAARARNAGFERLAGLAPEADYVQFIDGDCELLPGWLDAALACMQTHDDVAMVCGRLRERFPERSVYNLLCDIEWDAPPGEAKACGGIAMARAAAFSQANGFRRDMIAGEEPELCLRLRQAGWKIRRLDAEMALHDAAMHRFGQWWKRSMRAGYAFAEGACLHGRTAERHYVRESASALLWGLGIPAAAIFAVLWGGWAGLLLLAIYPLQVFRLGLQGQYSPRANWWRAFFLVTGKFPEMVGLVKFLLRSMTGSRQRLIEYK